MLHFVLELTPNEKKARAIVDAGTFAILGLSTKPEGFDIVTEQTLRRREGRQNHSLGWDSPNRYQEDGSPTPAEQTRQTFGKAVANEVDAALKFSQTTNLKKQVAEAHERQRLALERLDSHVRTAFEARNRDLIAQGKEPEDIEKILTSMRRNYSTGYKPGELIDEEMREAYLAAMEPRFKAQGSKVTIDEETNTVTFGEVRAVSFKSYQLFRKLGENPEALLELSDPLATAATVITSDGKIAWIVRDSKNSMYKDIPGVGAAGYLDAQNNPDPTKRGTPAPLTREKVMANIFGEAVAEIGVSMEDINMDESVIAGYAVDRVILHDELLITLKLNLTSEELLQKYNSNKYGDNDIEFGERSGLIFTEATPEAIGTFLTQLYCPLPPTHAASAIATGHHLMLKREELNAAKVWLANIQTGMQQNQQEINDIVRRYYDANPEVLINLLSKYSDLQLDGYDARLSPEEQGLPNAFEELKRIA